MINSSITPNVHVAGTSLPNPPLVGTSTPNPPLVGTSLPNPPITLPNRSIIPGPTPGVFDNAGDVTYSTKQDNASLPMPVPQPAPTPQLRTLPPRYVKNVLPPKYNTVTLPPKVVTSRLPPIGPPPTPQMPLPTPPTVGGNVGYGSIVASQTGGNVGYGSIVGTPGPVGSVTQFGTGSVRNSGLGATVANTVTL